MDTAPQPETPTICTEVQVMFFDTDCAGIIHNLAYLRFIETARTLLAEQLGMGMVGMAQSRVYPVLVRTEIDYPRAGQLGAKLEVHGRLESVERLRFWCSFEVRRAADAALLVQSRQMLALVQMPEAKPLRLPADWATRFAHLCPRKIARPQGTP
jgi:YbgC/YbaW family acyl-CoA thioester hydrolase